MCTISSNSREFDSAVMEGPPAEKIFPFESPTPTPTSFDWFCRNFANILPLSNPSRKFNSAATDATTSRENISAQTPDPD
jgi:hypothetical protein